MRRLLGVLGKPSWNQLLLLEQTAIAEGKKCSSGEADRNMKEFVPSSCPFSC